MQSRIIGVLAVACCFAVGLVSVAGAAPGDIDRTFGQEGFVTLDSNGAYTRASDMAVAADGSMYVLRSSSRCTSTCAVDHLVTRLRPNGGPDPSFGVGGTSAALGLVTGESVGLDASLDLGEDGRAVAAWTESGALIIQRLNPDGSLDQGFGSEGKMRYHFGVPIDRVQLAVQADGRIVVAAEPLAGYGGNAVVIARFTAQGGFDPGFHGGAPLFTSLGSGFGGFALAPGGSIAIGGPHCCSVGRSDVHVARLDPSGGFDEAFGRQGEVFVDDVGDGVGVGAVVVLPKGRVLVVGFESEQENTFLLRLRANGKLDRRFGHRGIAYAKSTHLQVAGATVDRTGRLLIFGSSPGAVNGTGPDRLTVLRRRPDGRPDLTFAGGRPVRLGPRATTHAVAGGLQDGRRLVVLANAGACFRTCPPPKNFLVRFIGGDSGQSCAGRRATIVGTRAGERLVGTRHADVIAALPGNDVVLGRGGNDVICGGRGNDRLVGGKGRDVLRGGAGRNKVEQ